MFTNNGYLQLFKAFFRISSCAAGERKNSMNAFPASRCAAFLTIPTVYLVCCRNSGGRSASASMRGSTTTLLEKLGLTAATKSKTKLVPATAKGETVATGGADIGFSNSAPVHFPS